MLPRFAADYRTLLWVALAPAVVAVQYARPDWVPYLCWLSAYLALACGVIAHNHNHCPTFKSKWQNQVFGSFISIFYGYPTFAWIPTHNLNHHKLVNRPGDATITWRYTNKHNALVAGTYFFVSSYFQGGPIRTYIRKARESNRPLYRRILAQYAVWAGGHVVLLSTAVYLHGLKTGVYLWALSCFVPAFFALWTIMLFNYVQHVHTDPWSQHNHSRSFDGKLVNFLLFNNGLHAAHHENPGTHWSKLWELHERIAPNIDPRLIHRSMWWFFFKQYVLALFIPRHGTEQVGRAPFDTLGADPWASGAKLITADVELGDAGSNANMVRG
jgi:fatty acid desaturase